MTVRFLVYNIWGLGGTVRTVANISNYLAEKGYTVVIISVRRTAEKTAIQLSDKIEIVSLYDMRYEQNKDNSFWKKRLLKRRSRLIHKDEDLYEMFSRYTDKELMKVLREIHDGVFITTIPSFNMLSVKHVKGNVIKIGQEHKELGDHSENIIRMIRESYHQLDGLTIVTEQSLPQYQELVQDHEFPICVLGNGTRMIYHRSPLNRKVIVAAGRLSEEKGFAHLINAFRLIAGRHPDWIVKIFGQGEKFVDLERLVAEKGLSQQVFLCPTTELLTEELSNAAFSVCSSNREGFGMVIIEGMAVGVPCVSFACEGPKQIISDGEDGFLVEKGDIAGLAERMEFMMEHDGARAKMGEMAFQKSQNYDIMLVGEKLESFIISLEEKRRCRGRS